MVSVFTLHVSDGSSHYEIKDVWFGSDFGTGWASGVVPEGDATEKITL